MAKADRALKEKLSSLGYAEYDVKPGEEEVPMLYVQSQLICSVEYALSLSEDTLHALIAETVGGQA